MMPRKEYVPGDERRAQIKLSREARDKHDEILGSVDHVLTRTTKPTRAEINARRRP